MSDSGSTASGYLMRMMANLISASWNLFQTALWPAWLSPFTHRRAGELQRPGPASTAANADRPVEYCTECIERHPKYFLLVHLDCDHRICRNRLVRVVVTVTMQQQYFYECRYICPICKMVSNNYRFVIR